MHCWVNGDTIAQADVGSIAYMVDDATVSKDGTGKASPALSKRSTRAASGSCRAFRCRGDAMSSIPTKMIISCPIPAYSAIADAGVLLRLTPGFAGRVKSMHVQATTPASTTTKTSTLTVKIGSTAVTGGVVVMTTAGQIAIGSVQDGTAVTAADEFTATDVLTVVASATTAFVEGAGVIYLVLG